jgi:hypothetical protein
MWHVWGRRETHTGFRWGNLKYHLEDLRVNGIIIFSFILQKRESVWECVVGIIIRIEATGLGKPAG